MKKLFLSIAMALTLTTAISANFQYEQENISLDLSSLTQEQVTVKVAGTSTHFYHTASQEAGYDGWLATIEAISPVSDLFGVYNHVSYQVLGICEDTVYLYHQADGGIPTSQMLLGDYTQVKKYFTYEALLETMNQMEALPILDSDATYMKSEVALDQVLTHHRLSQWLGELFPTVTNVVDYGILPDDGTHTITRGEFAAILHRLHFVPPVGLYGDDDGFSDVSVHDSYIHSAYVLGWMQGYEDGCFRPEQPITIGAAITALNRSLCRDQSAYPDLFSANLLEAMGQLNHHGQEGFVTDTGKLAQSLGIAVDSIFYFNDLEGILVGRTDETPCIILQTDDGGATWSEYPAKESVFPHKQFGSEETMNAALRTVVLRPTGIGGVYLQVYYQPYDSVYSINFVAMKQSVLKEIS